jgi:hypothetical protein
MLPCLDCIFGSTLQFFIFISTCESWQPILKSNEEFAKWVLNVGGGNLPSIAEEEGVDPNWIKIPSHMRLPVKDCSLRRLIRTIYSDHWCHFGDAMYLM